MHAMRREHTPNVNSLRSLPLQALEADINLASLGGPTVRRRPRIEGIKIEDTRTERREKRLNRGNLILVRFFLAINLGKQAYFKLMN